MKVMQAAQRFDDDVEHNMATIARLRPRIVGMTEMSNGPADDTKLVAAQRILGAVGFTVYTDDHGEHSREIPVGIRLGRRYVTDDFTVIQLSPDLPGDGLGNDRWLAIWRGHTRILRRKKAHAHTHWNAGLQGPHGNMLDDPRVVAAGKGSAIMEGTLRNLQREGRDLTVTGDFNWREHPNDPAFHGWTHSPPAMFGRLNLACASTGLDWMAWSKTLREVGQPTVLQPGQGGNGADHPWSIHRLVQKVLPR